MPNSTLSQPLPLEYLPALGSALDGAQASNRGTSDACTNDLEAINFWLDRVAHSRHTYRSYRKEIERLLLFCLLVKRQALSDLSAPDLVDYKKFLKDQQPHELWLGPRRPRAHPEWKPFEKQLTPASQNQALVILQNAFAFFVDLGYWRNNPGKLVSSQDLRYAINKKDGVERYIDKECWRYLWGFIQDKVAAAAEGSQQHKRLERDLLLFTLLYLQAPRVSELANARMGDISLKRGNWWWEITGKGNKTALVPLHQQSLTALQRYRRCFNFASATPQPQETSPLLGHITNPQVKALSADSIWRAVTDMAQAAAAVCTDRQQAQLLNKVSTHWLRHTSITHQAENGVELRYLQAIARHASIATTQKYLHQEERRWVEEYAKHSLVEG